MSDLPSLAARVVVPVLDLRPGQPGVPEGQRERDPWERARELRDLGVGGLILFGGERETLAAGLADLRAAGQAPLLIGADLERGVGQQVQGGSTLPPLLALGAADSPQLAQRVGRALGQEALGFGIDWIYAPVLDLADEPENPIVGTRALAADPARVAALGVAFVEGIQSAGALACAKHYPGHGGTLRDSHASAASVEHSAERLQERDLAPFRAAIEAGVASVMSAHVAFPALDPSQVAGGELLPATRSATLQIELLRESLGFQGLVVSDALLMDGVRVGGLSEAEAGLACLDSGCDLLLYPEDPEGLIAALVTWAEADPAQRARLEQAAARVEALAARVGSPTSLDDDPRALEVEVFAAAQTRVGEPAPALQRGDSVALLVVDDDGQGTLAHALAAELRAAGVEVYPAGLGPEPSAEAKERFRAIAAAHPRRIVAVGCQTRAWKERAGLAADLVAEVRGLPASGTQLVGLCGPYALAGLVNEEVEVLIAYGDAPAAERSAAAVLLGRAEALGSLPVPLAGLRRPRG
jgi:beta-glucosidase-like glycosyl hydrolase